MSAKSLLAKIVVHGALLLGSALFLFPLVWMFATSAKPISQAIDLPPRLLPYCMLAAVAYGFARIRWPGRDIAFALTIATMMIPFPVLMVPVYVLFKHLGWIGSPKPLWVPAFFGSAFNIFLLRQFFMSLPFELSDAARI